MTATIIIALAIGIAFLIAANKTFNDMKNNKCSGCSGCSSDKKKSCHIDI